MHHEVGVLRIDRMSLQLSPVVVSGSKTPYDKQMLMKIGRNILGDLLKQLFWV